MGGSKSAIGSVTIWGALLAVVASGVQLLGYSFSADDQAAMVNLIQSGVTVATTVASILGGVVAIYGRVKATKEIGTVATAPAVIVAAPAAPAVVVAAPEAPEAVVVAPARKAARRPAAKRRGR